MNFWQFSTRYFQDLIHIDPELDIMNRFWRVIELINFDRVRDARRGLKWNFLFQLNPLSYR